jgi:putative hydrolase of the HAD superfamily
MPTAKRRDTVLFDADGVIQRAPADLQARVAAAVGAQPERIGDCIADFFAAEAPGLTGAADLAETLAPVLVRWGSVNDVAAVMAEWLTIEVDRSVLAVIADLRAAGVHCAIASNQEGHRARYMSEVLGYRDLFDREFYSCHLGHAKPMPGYFAEVLRRGAFGPARTLFIDDRIDNVEAARAAGLSAEQFELDVVGAGGGPLRRLLNGYGLG